jgi:superfamily II DNA/RNA helicase
MFLNTEFHPSLEGYFKEQGLKTATLIQKRVIPEIINRKSVVVLSETGSGKTLAYALPIVSNLKKREEKNGVNTQKGTPFALIVAPTRELASQIFNVFKGISYHSKLRVRDLTGGDTHAKMKSVAASSYEILIATPSRVKSAIQKKELSLNQLQYVIFDEADQLFDMGFKKDLDFMIEYFDLSMLQLGFITATLPLEVENYILEKFPEVKFQRIASDVSHAPQSRIETYNVKITPSEKDMVVRMFLEKQAQGRGIIFTNQKNQADDLNKYLSEKMPKLKIKLLHGDLEKKDREAAIRSFVEKKAQVLIATDVAARGIDIPDLQWVLNYGLPKTGIYYLHRCGRVARGGRKGIVYNLVASHDAKMINQINEAILNQKHLNLDVIPENKMKEEKRDLPKVEKKPATFRGKTSQRARGAARVQKTEKELRNAPPVREKRNRGIKRRR